jgi:predicted molibdopterin-dependent oxidoreductase YjgC
MEDDLGAYQRGHHTEILPPPGREIRNLYSGNVVQYCPVGALTNNDWRYKVRVWKTGQAAVICPHCPDGCNMTLWTFHNKLFRATSRTNDHVDNGFLCDIGRYGYQFVTSSDRIRQPLIKKAGELVEASWEEALSFIKSRTDDLKKKLSGSGFFGFVGDESSNEEIYSFSRFLRRVIGTNNIDHRLHRKRKLVLDSDIDEIAHGDQVTYTDIEKADVILVLGSDLHSENPITALRVKKAIRRHGAKLILANVRPTPLGIRAAHSQAVYKPGTEAVFLLGIIDAVIDAPGMELGALGLDISQIEEFRRKHGEYNSQKAAAICGVDQAIIEQIAELIAGADRVMILTGHDVFTHPYRDSICHAIADLKLLCKSAASVTLPLGSNSRGAEIFGAEPNMLPGCVSMDNKAAYEDKWRGPIPEMIGKDTIGILEAVTENEIECGFIFRADQIRTFPDGALIKKALEALRFLVVIDTFMTDTSRAADCVLPLATFAESDGTRTNWEGRLQYSEAAIAPLYDSKPGCEIVELLAERLGNEYSQSTPESVYREMAEFSGGRLPENPASIGGEGVLLRFGDRKPVLKLTEIDYSPLPENEDYPLLLMVGQADHHRGSLTERNDSLLKFSPEPYVGLSPGQADRLTVADGDLVKVESQHGKVVGPAVVMYDLPDGLVFLPENFSEMQPNTLMSRQEKANLVKLVKM